MNTHAYSPTVRRRRLALELRRLREAAGLTCDDVAARLECSASKISRIETGRALVSPRDTRDMLQIYGVPEEQRETFFLQVIPFTSGAYIGMDLPFVVLGFPDQLDPDVVGLGYQTGALWIEDVAEVDRYNRFFHHLQAAALSFNDSTALMTSVLKQM